MKAVEWYGPRAMRLVDIATPSPKPHEVLLRIESVGVCGSDIHYYTEGRIGNQILQGPTILGHEYAGIVDAVGAHADPALLGKRVAVEPGIPCMKCEWCRSGRYNICRDMFFPGGPGCNGALCEYMTVHAAFCFPVPETMSAAVAAMLEPLAVAIHTIELAQVKPGETAAIFGLGSIGLLVAQVARFSGVRILYGADLFPNRVAVSSRYGVQQAWNASTENSVERILEATGGRGVDIAFDCSNRSETLSHACLVTRPGGRCVLTGISGVDYDPIPVSAVRRKELTLQWCRRFCHNYPTAIALVNEGHIDVESLITHRFALDETAAAFDLVADTRDNVIKASIDQ